MKKHLTDAAIQRYRAPKEGSMEIFDLGYPGLAVRVGHGGAKAFVLFHRQNGKLKRTTLGRWPAKSLAEAREAWRRVAEGKTPTESQAKGELFSTLVEDWLRLDAAQRNKPSSLKIVHHLIDHDVLPVWRDKHVSEIDRIVVTALLDSMIARGVPAKAKQVAAYLGRCFKWAVSRGRIAVNPMDLVEKPAGGKSRERVLSDKELTQVWEACDGAAGNVVKLLILTGARREEIAQLKWSEVVGDEIHLAGERTKNGEARIIPLSPQAKAILANTPRIEGPFVFTTDGLKGMSGWSRIKDKLDATCGVKGWVIHDLRRTLATGMQKLGVALQVVETILGHTGGSREGIVKVYQRHNFADEKKAALEAWGKHVESLTR